MTIANLVDDMVIVFWLTEWSGRGIIGHSDPVHTDLVKAEQRIMLHWWGNLQLRGQTLGIISAPSVSSGAMQCNKPSMTYSVGQPMAVRICDTSLTTDTMF